MRTTIELTTRSLGASASLLVYTVTSKAATLQLRLLKTS
jgi:hypothetical protein